MCLILRWWKEKTAPHVIGLDIGPESLKILKINNNMVPFHVENFIIESLPPDTFDKGEIKNESRLSILLKDALKLAGIKSKKVALAIPRSAAIIKNISIDNRLSQEDIESRVWIEANRHFPELVEDIYLDFSVIGPAPNDATQSELSLVACRKDQIKPYLEILKLSGLLPSIVDVNSYALERALSVIANSTSDIDTIALLNLDISLSTFIVVQNKKLIYAHDQSFDGHRLLTQTQEYEKNKTEGDAEKQATIFKENLSAHSRHTLHFFFTSRPNVNIQKIFLSGDCAMISGLAAFIQNEVGIETAVANPFYHATFASHIDKSDIEKHAPVMMLSLGLALSKMGEV